MDILKELYEGLITEDEVYDKIDQVREDIDKGLYREFCYVDEEGLTRCDLAAIMGMDRYEYTAHCHGVPLSVIADWRYNGWPTKYFDTGEPVNYKEGYWLGGKYGLMSLRENKDKLRKKKNKLHKKKDKRHKKKDKLHKKKDKQRKKKK